MFELSTEHSIQRTVVGSSCMFRRKPANHSRLINYKRFTIFIPLRKLILSGRTLVSAYNAMSQVFLNILKVTINFHVHVHFHLVLVKTFLKF